MSIKKQYLKRKPLCKVTFRLPKEAIEGAKNVTIVGDFNDWEEEATPLQPLKSGDYKALLELEVGKSYQYRYLIDGETWENDWAADNYVASPFSGIENSVIEI